MTDRPQSNSVARDGDEEPMEEAGGGAASGRVLGSGLRPAGGRRAAGAAGQRVPPGPGERSSVPVEAELRFRYLQLGKRQRRPLLALAARVAVDGLPARGGVVAEGGAGAARPSKWESRATCGADAARGERGAYVTFTDRIPRSVGGEIEQTGEEMWQQPLSTAGRYFSSSFTPALA